MAGTIVTERVAGIPTGFPAEIDANVKIRWVAPMLTNMSERSVDFLKYIGGPESFSFNSTTIEWVEDDPWNRSLIHTGLAAAGTTSLVVTGGAFRYPIGTVLIHQNDAEYVRVTGHVDVDTLTIARDITAGVTEGAWAAADIVLVAAFAMDENDDYVFRPTSIFTLPVNRPQVHQAGVQASFRRQETALYGTRGNDLDMQAANLVAEQFVSMEQSLIHGARFAGSAAVPSMMGGLRFYVTTANLSEVVSLAGAAMTRADIDNRLQAIFLLVGGDKMSRTLLVPAWPKRKISSFFSAAERMGPGMAVTGGITVDRLNTDFGVVDVILEMGLLRNEIFFIRKENISMGHHGNLGRPQLRLLPPSTVGPRTQKVFYADMSAIVSGLQAMGRLTNISTTS